MLGTNNLDVLDVLLKFADENIRNPIVSTSCPSGGGNHDNDEGDHDHGGDHGHDGDHGH
jgi:hypothetical protein